MLTVKEANDPPTISGLGDITAQEGTIAGPLPFIINDPDTDLNELSFTTEVGNPNLIPETNIKFGGNGANRTVTIMPPLGQTGTTTVRILLTDGQFIASTGFSVTITAALIPPQISQQPLSQTISPGAAVTFSVIASGSAPLSYQWQRNGVNLVQRFINVSTC